ncbi:MAG: hypothetical protein ABIS86_17050 [Streptosporangiaceae bacterium]
MSGTYTFGIDWNNDGDFSDTGEDVTARVQEEVTIDYGRDQARALSPIATGSAAFELLNTSRDYSPENTSSPLNGQVLPARPARIQAALTLVNDNPDFETSAAGWTPFGSSVFTRSSAFARTGAYSGRLTSDAASDPRVESAFGAVTPGVQYAYAGWVYSPIALAPQASVGVNWFTAASAYISTDQTLASIVAGNWVFVTGTATAPPTAGFANIRFGMGGTPGAGVVVYGDGMRLTTAPVTLFRGYMDEFNILPAIGDRKVAVTLLDGLAKVKESKASTTLYPSIRTGAAIGAILDAVGWPPGLRDLDAGATTLRWWCVNGAEAWQAIQDIVSAEGSPALITCDGSGNVVFRDRHHRLVRAASTTSQATLRDIGTEPLFSPPLVYDQGWRDIINDVSFSVDERGPADELTEIWSSDLTYTVGASATLSFTISTTEPFYAAAVTSYTVLSGSAGVSIDDTQGQATTVNINAGPGGAAVTGISIGGHVVGTLRAYQVTASDAGSIATYGSRSGPDGTGAACLEDAQALANLAVLTRKVRLPIVTLNVIGAGGTRMGQCLNRNLSDRVTVVDAETGLNRPFYIEQIKHTIVQAGLLHTTTFGCEAVPTASGLDDPTTVFIFDHATNGKFGTGKFAT